MQLQLSELSEPAEWMAASPDAEEASLAWSGVIDKSSGCNADVCNPFTSLVS